jgi:hypothetical protein
MNREDNPHEVMYGQCRQEKKEEDQQAQIPEAPEGQPS